MARVTFSALLSAASGKIGDVVFSRWKGTAYVRTRVVPSNPRTGAQCLQRHVLSVALLLWQSIKALGKAPWDLNVSAEAISGYNKFMDLCIGTLIPQYVAGGQGAEPTWDTPAITVGFPHNPAYVDLISPDDGTPETGAVAFTWTARAGAASKNVVHAWYRLDDATAWTYHSEVAESTETLTVDGLVNDSQYEFMLAGQEDVLDVYCQSHHALATPAA